MKTKAILGLLLFVPLLSSNVAAGRIERSPRLVFEGIVLRIGKAPAIVCGVTAPYRLVEYRVDRIYEGSYDKPEIVVDHLFCQLDMLNELKVGDHVLVVADQQERPIERSNDGLIRKSTDIVREFYIARRVAISTSCCAH